MCRVPQSIPVKTEEDFRRILAKEITKEKPGLDWRKSKPRRSPRSCLGWTYSKSEEILRSCPSFEEDKQFDALELNSYWTLEILLVMKIDQSYQLLHEHTYTDCDNHIVLLFCCWGKNTVWDTWMNFDDITSAFGALAAIPDRTQITFEKHFHLFPWLPSGRRQFI